MTNFRLLSTCLFSVLLLTLSSCATQPDSTDPGPAAVSAGSGDSSAQANSTEVSSSGASPVPVDARPFPRSFTVRGTAFDIHQPQYEQWADDQLSGRFVMAVQTGTHTGSDGKSVPSYDYGVVQFSARTQVDKESRSVVLSELRLNSANFPTASSRQEQYLSLARTQLQQTATLTVSLDQLESAIAIAKVDARGATSQPVSNQPPDIIFSTSPAMLILVDGTPSLRDAGAEGVQRVINTRSLLLQYQGAYYTVIANHWLRASSLAGPWSEAGNVARPLQLARQQVSAGHQVDTMDDPPEDLKKQLDAGQLPAVYVRTHAAELISVQGDPQFAEIPNTHLTYISNTGADVIIDAATDNAWYVLVSGRWFTAASSQGPWSYVAAGDLPDDFRQIPPDSPKSGVLASIPGTPEAQESLIANNIPQTATVQRQQASLTVSYDGDPQFAPIDGTSLQYAKNTAVPVILATDGAYYAVDKGVWFVARTAIGPWQVADAIPSEIYSIPTSSPLHYVTYVRIYGSTPQVVYVGYTPGYYGTVVSDNVVVYGTGYACDPWLGAYWYGCPATYGMGVYFGWNPWVGWSFGIGFGFYAGWYGPWAPWWGPWYGPAYPWGWWGGGAAAWNVYGHWGNAAVHGTAAAWANPWTGNFGRAARGGYYNERTGGRGAGRAAINTNVYTGTTTAAAQGVRYNPETGRVVGGTGRVAVNPYTDQAAAAGRRTTVNTNTGRVTQSGGAAAAGEHGAAGAGGFHTEGPGGNSAAGAGGFHYNADSGSLHHSGVYDINDHYYAGHDGHVYHYDDGNWNKVGPGDRSGGNRLPDNLDSDRLARERGNQRVHPGYGELGGRSGFQRPQGYNRPVGGFRSGLGARPMGGGFRRR